MEACTYKTGRGCFPRKEYHKKAYRSYETYQRRKRSRCQGLRQGECESRSPLCQWRRGGSKNRFRCYRGDRAAYELENSLLALAASAPTPLRLLSLPPSASLQQPLYQLQRRLNSLVSYLRTHRAAYDAGVLPETKRRLFIAAEDELDQYSEYYSQYHDRLNLSPSVEDELNKVYELSVSQSSSSGRSASLSPPWSPFVASGTFSLSPDASPSYAGGLGGPSPASAESLNSLGSLGVLGSPFVASPGRGASPQSPQQPLPPAHLPLFAAARQRVVNNAASALQNASGNPQAAVQALTKAARETLLVVESISRHVPSFDASVQDTLSMKLQYLTNAARAALQTSPAAFVQTASTLKRFMENLNQFIQANPLFVAPQDQPAAMSNEEAADIVRNVSRSVSRSSAPPLRRSARQASLRRKATLRKR